MGKFIFDGANLRIRFNQDAVNGNVLSFTINELWSEWIDWVAESDNSKYPMALRTAGGDPIGGGQYIGTYLFLRNDNGWLGVPPAIDPCTIMIEGSFFGEDPYAPVMENLPQQTDLIINRSSLTMAIETTGGGTGTGFSLAEIASAVWSHANRSLSTSASGMTEEEHTKLMELENVDIQGVVNAVWNKVI